MSFNIFYEQSAAVYLFQRQNLIVTNTHKTAMKFSLDKLSFLTDSLPIVYEYKPRVSYIHVCSFARNVAHTEELEQSFTFQLITQGIKTLLQ